MLALSVTVKVAVSAPMIVGLKVTLMVQVAPAATLAPQLFVCPKLLLLVPVKVMLVMPRAVPWELVRVTA